jgi:hypothetical protein
MECVFLCTVFFVENKILYQYNRSLNLGCRVSFLFIFFALQGLVSS